MECETKKQKVDVLSRDVWSVVCRFLTLGETKLLSQTSSEIRHIVFQYMVHHYAWDVDYAHVLRGRGYVVPHVFSDNHGDIPHGTMTVRFGHYFNQPLAALPSTVHSITLGKDFNQECTEWPPALRHLDFSDADSRCTEPIHVPEGLVTLRLRGAFNMPITPLPSTLKALWLPHNYAWPLQHIPSSLEHLVLMDAYQMTQVMPRHVVTEAKFCIYLRNILPLDWSRIQSLCDSI